MFDHSIHWRSDALGARRRYFSSATKPAQGAQINGITTTSRAVDKYDAPYDCETIATISTKGSDNTSASRTPSANPFKRGIRLVTAVVGAAPGGLYGFSFMNCGCTPSVGERLRSPRRGERFSIVKTLGSATGVHRLVLPSSRRVLSKDHIRFST